MANALPTLVKIIDEEVIDDVEVSLYGRWQVEIDGRTHEVGCEITSSCDYTVGMVSSYGPWRARFLFREDFDHLIDPVSALEIMGRHAAALARKHGLA